MNLMPWTNKARAAAISGLAGLLCLAAALGAPAGLSTNPAPDQLLLRGGDSLDGKLLAIDPQQGLVWKHPDVAEPIEFNLDRVAQIRFRPSAPPGAPAFSATEPPCKVFLAGGDTLDGCLVSYDRTNLCLQTWYAGPLKIPRQSLRSVYFPPVAPDIFTQTGPEGWTQGTGAAAAFSGDPGEWVYRYGAFYASKSASIARDIKLPPAADIQFDLAWSGAPSLSLALYTDSLQPLLLSEKDTAPAFGGFYSMQFLPGLFVNLARVNKNEPVLGLDAPVAVPALGRTNRVRLEIRARKQSSIIALSVDGQPAQVWRDTNGFVGEGSGIRFVHNTGGLIKVSDLRITPWDGVLEDNQTNLPPSSQDIASLTNAATLAGEIVEAAQGKMTLRGKRETTVVPLSQVLRLTFSGANDQPGIATAGAVRAWFTNGASLTFVLERWGAEGVDIRSPAFGPARFSPETFARIVFPPRAGGSTNALK
jgi:hypothetical protein